jgi:hypothetical protein
VETLGIWYLKSCARPCNVVSPTEPAGRRDDRDQAEAPSKYRDAGGCLKLGICGQGGARRLRSCDQAGTKTASTGTVRALAAEGRTAHADAEGGTALALKVRLRSHWRRVLGLRLFLAVREA